ncbi:glucose repression mediator protein [Entomophthora muscae]|uniref:Glucose repression mediator protein n=1 Tax=Entomophthora muscae TaxID=34485 RepID=A0ACC2UMK9_9FUNG|nr:glucose repression mediator protein [Entomophthora muscae]
MASINPPAQMTSLTQKLSSQNETVWIQIGSLAEQMSDFERAIKSYESALRHNPYSFSALFKIATLCRGREQYQKATDFFQRALNIDGNNGEVWGALGHCFLMMDELQKAYSAYQQALYHLPNPKDPKLWYGIGILYDRYGSLDHAEEAFSAVMRMEPKFDKGNEIYFRLGIIYKQQSKFDLSLQCFRYILHAPPRPLTEVDIWFQIGHVYEQQKEYVLAKEAYERVLAENSAHAKVLQQLGWLYHQQSAPYCDQEKAISYLNLSIEADNNDAQTWYLLGRCYMAQSKFNKAYDSYQQAVYRDGRNPTFWCSIGVLYYQINQFRDALDAYSRAIRLNPHISEVWYDLGTLYESCNNQIDDARDAYNRALELDPNNPLIRARLAYLNSSQTGGNVPVPQDVNPSNYPNNGFSGPNGQFSQGPLGPPPGVQSFPSRPENLGSVPPPLQFTQGNGERPPTSGSELLAPLGHPSKLSSPTVRGNQNLPNLMRDEQGRLAEMGPMVGRGHPADHHMGHDGFRPPLSQHGYRQHMKRPDLPGGPDGRKMSCPSPGIRPPPHQRMPDGGYYHDPHHNDRRDYEDLYKQRGPPPPGYRHEQHHGLSNPFGDRHGFPDHGYPGDRRPPPPRPMHHPIHDRNQNDDRGFHLPDIRNMHDDKQRSLPPHISRPSDPLKQDPRGMGRYVDEDYDGAADTLASISESGPAFKSKSKQNSGDPSSHYMMGQRSTPLRSPKVHSTADSHHENNPSKSPAQNSAQAS